MFRSSTALAWLCAAVALFFYCAGSRAHAQAEEDPNLPIFVSPIEITGLPLQFRLAYLDPEGGAPVDVAPPLDLISPRLNDLLSTPLSSALDRSWNTDNPLLGGVPRQVACAGSPAMPGGIQKQLEDQIAALGDGVRAYDIECHMAQTGLLFAQQEGSSLTIAYELRGNSVKFAVTSPATCHEGNGTIVCPNDARFSVTFTAQVIITLHLPGLCNLGTSPVTVRARNVNVEAENGIAEVAQFFAGNKFVAAEQAVMNASVSIALPLQDAFVEQQLTEVCARRNALARGLTALHPEIDPPRAVFVRIKHPGLVTPSLWVPNSPTNPPQPPVADTFRISALALDQPQVAPGATFVVRGVGFAPNTNLSTALPIIIDHGGVAGEGPLICERHATQIEWGPVGGSLRLESIDAAPGERCATSFEATVLLPNTAYQFRSRICDVLSCSPWSPLQTTVTLPVDTAKPDIVITLDGALQLAIANADGRGRFAVSVSLPADTTLGRHQLLANGNEGIPIEVGEPAPGPALMAISSLGEFNGCASYPGTGVRAGMPFKLFGRGFATDAPVAIHVDSPVGPFLGHANLNFDGSFCQQFPGAPSDVKDDHVLVAVQNGAVVASWAINFYSGPKVH